MSHPPTIQSKRALTKTNVIQLLLAFSIFIKRVVNNLHPEVATIIVEHKDNTDKAVVSKIDHLLHPGIDLDPVQCHKGRPLIRVITAVKMNMVITERLNVKVAEKLLDHQHITPVEQVEAQVMVPKAHEVVCTMLEAEKRDIQAGHFLHRVEVEVADNSIMLVAKMHGSPRVTTSIPTIHTSWVEAANEAVEVEVQMPVREAVVVME